MNVVETVDDFRENGCRSFFLRHHHHRRHRHHPPDSRILDAVSDEHEGGSAGTVVVPCNEHVALEFHIADIDREQSLKNG